MGDFVVTRSAIAKGNVQDDFVAVTFTARKAKAKADAAKKNSPDEEDESPPSDPKRQQELEMKRLRWDVIKFGSSNLDGSMKHAAKVAHAMQLGAKLPKSRRNENYKDLKMKAKWEKIKAEKQNDSQESGLLKSLKKPKKRREKRVRNDILDVYGKVQKGGIKKK